MMGIYNLGAPSSSVKARHGNLSKGPVTAAQPQPTTNRTPTRIFKSIFYKLHFFCKNYLIKYG